MARAVIKGRVDMDGKGAEVALTKSQQGAVRFKNKMKQVGAAIGAAFAIGIIVRFAKEITDLGSKLSDMATAAGIGTDEFQALSLAARDAGASEDQLTNSLSRLKVAQGRVIEGDVTMEKAFKSLRIPIEDVVKMSLPELFKAVADGLTKANNGAQEFNATAQILGVRNTPKLLEALNRLSEEGFEGLTTAAIEAGQVMDKDVIAKMDETADQLLRTKRTIQVFFADIISWTITAAESFGTFWGAVSAVGFREAWRQGKAGELFDQLETSPGKITEQEKADKARAARVSAFQARLDKERAEREEKLKKNLALKAGSGSAMIDQLVKIGAGGRAQVDMAQREARRLDTTRNRLLERSLELQGIIAQQSGNRSGFRIT